MKKVFAWIEMVMGALMVFVDISIIFTGWYAKNLLIILIGLIGVGIGVYLIMTGKKTRKLVLTAVKK